MLILLGMHISTGCPRCLQFFYELLQQDTLQLSVQQYLAQFITYVSDVSYV